MADSNIEWTDKVWNPVTGCTQISAGCKNCYAKRMANRLKGRYGYPALTPFMVTPHPKRLDEPLRWKKPKRIFVCSMGDLFHEDVPDGFISKVLNVAIRGAHRHTYLILTKRAERMQSFMQNFYEGIGETVCCRNYETGEGIPTKPCPRIYLGVSVEDQATADERIPLLLQTPAAKRFVSYEPALGPVDFERIQWPDKHKVDVLRGGAWDAPGCPLGFINHSDMATLDQIIMGGETGPGARPLHPDWARSVRDQCKEAGVPFFFKQWGEWHAENNTTKVAETHPWGLFRVGKKEAGHLLDGKEYRDLI